MLHVIICLSHFHIQPGLVFNQLDRDKHRIVMTPLFGCFSVDWFGFFKEGRVHNNMGQTTVMTFCNEIICTLCLTLATFAIVYIILLFFDMFAVKCCVQLYIHCAQKDILVILAALKPTHLKWCWPNYMRFDDILSKYAASVKLHFA